MSVLYARVPDELHARLVAFANERSITIAQAAAELLTRALARVYADPVPTTTCIRCGYRLYWSARRNEYRRREKGHGQNRIDCGNGNHIPRVVPA